MLKIFFIFFAIFFALNLGACTTILVGSKASEDGSLMVARSADSKATKAQIFIIHPEANHTKGAFHSSKEHGGANDFTWPLPEHTMRYTTIANWQTKLHGAVGFNSAGMGLSGTETIFAKDKLLKIDPYTKDGITEDDIPDVILPIAKTAKEGVLLLGKIIEEKGAAEGFGVAFVDSSELWYLETGTGHEFLAQKIPNDKYLASANQTRLTYYDQNSSNFIASKNLIKFAIDNGTYNPTKDGKFNFFKAYSKDDEEDITYNYPRVWWIQKMFNPSLKQEIKDGANFATFLTPEKKITLNELKDALRSHYEGTKYDYYNTGNFEDNIYRPISVFRTYESHIMQVRPWLPIAIGRVVYVAIGMADLSVYLPYYEGLSGYIDGYNIGTNQADDISIYWTYRKLQSLVMVNYKKFAPIVKSAYKEFEDNLALNQEKMEQQYLLLFKTDPNKAQKLLDDFSKNAMNSAKFLTKSLTNQIFTLLTDDLDLKYKSLNNGKKD